jgi:hypothetical protein
LFYHTICSLSNKRNDFLLIETGFREGHWLIIKNISHVPWMSNTASFKWENNTIMTLSMRLQSVHRCIIANKSNKSYFVTSMTSMWTQECPSKSHSKRKYISKGDGKMTNLMFWQHRQVAISLDYVELIALAVLSTN